MFSKLLATAVAAVAFSFPAHAEICLLTVNERVHMEGSCTFKHFSDGSRGFSVDDNRRNVFAMVSIEGDGRGIGYWNEYESRAHSYLGELKRVGACWSNSQATLCAWAD